MSGKKSNSRQAAVKRVLIAEAQSAATKQAVHDFVVDFNVTREEQIIITKIVKRAYAMDLIAPGFKSMDLDMDLCATIAQGVPLRLQELLDADDFNFAHDVCGIQRHMNRRTGELMNCFLPRFFDSKKAKEIGDATENPIQTMNRILDAMADHADRKAGKL